VQQFSNRAFSFAVLPPFVITTNSPLPSGTQGTAYSFTLNASGGTLPYVAWIVLSGSLPAGLSLSNAGVISGTPSVAMVAGFTVQVTDTAGNHATQIFALTVQSGTGLPSASPDFRMINQGGPNNGNTSGIFHLSTCSMTYTPSNPNYLGLCWLAATQGANPIAQYNIYRTTLTLGVPGPQVLYDSVSTPVTITGFIDSAVGPSFNPTGVAGTTLHVTNVIGGASANGFSDGKIHSGLLLTSAASGFQPGTLLGQFSAGTGSGGNGNYALISAAQLVGSIGSPATFTAWVYNDTVATGANDPTRANANTIYIYRLAAQDSLGGIGPQASPSMYFYCGGALIQGSMGLYDYGGVTSSATDTVGAPVNGPYDFSVTWASGNGGMNTPMGSGAGNNLCPGASLEVGAFTNFEFDIKVTDNLYQTVHLGVIPVTGAAGVIEGPCSIDASHINEFNLWTYVSPVVGGWAHVKIPFSVLPYGWINTTASFVGTSQYHGNLTVTAIGTKSCFGIDGSSRLIAPGIPAGTYITGPNTMNAGGIGTFACEGPNIVGTENVASQAVYLQNTGKYKWGLQWLGSTGGTSPTYYFNNFRYT
jgi:Putative Ig domain